MLWIDNNPTFQVFKKNQYVSHPKFGPKGSMGWKKKDNDIFKWANIDEANICATF